MSNYLRKYVGTYRVKADYDLETNDFPRDYEGKIDESFDDLYIDCKNNIKIRHGVRNVLSCYIPSKARGMAILRQIYIDKIGDNLPKEKTSENIKYLENLCNELVKKEVLVSADVLDSECYFEFRATMIEYIANLVGAKTSGKSISPYSIKNLPKAPYKIPAKDIDEYKQVLELLPHRQIGNKSVPDGFFINTMNKNFDDIILTENPKLDVNADRKKKGLKAKEYYHSIGYWDKYLEFLRKAK